MRNSGDDFLQISIGWGDKGFYLDTPTWAELKLSTALIAGFGLGNAALHITYYDEIAEDDLTYCWDAKNLATECIHTWPADAL